MPITPLQSIGLRGTPQHLRCSDRAAETARRLRRGRPGRLDVVELASELGVTVLYRAMAVTLHGVTFSTRRVTVNANLPVRRRRFALVHELAHVLVARGQCPYVEAQDEERFADRFARHILLPLEDVAAAATTDDLAAIYEVDQDVVSLQMAELERAPAIARSGAGSILCVHCGTQLRRLACECARYRVNPRLAADLPVV